MPSQMEKILGASFGRLVIPGTADISGTEILYYSENGRDTAERLFSAITRYTDPPNAQSGGASPYGCELTLPDGSIFHAVGFHGDLDGWRKDIESGARALSLFLAKVVGDRIVVSDGREFRLADCKARFY